MPNRETPWHICPFRFFFSSSFYYLFVRFVCWCPSSNRHFFGLCEIFVEWCSKVNIGATKIDLRLQNLVFWSNTLWTYSMITASVLFFFRFFFHSWVEWNGNAYPPTRGKFETKCLNAFDINSWMAIIYLIVYITYFCHLSIFKLQSTRRKSIMTLQFATIFMSIESLWEWLEIWESELDWTIILCFIVRLQSKFSLHLLHGALRKKRIFAQLAPASNIFVGSAWLPINERMH